MLEQDGRAIIVTEKPLPWPLRIFALILGLGIGIVVPAPFLIHADWGWPETPAAAGTLLVAVFAILAGVSFGLFLLWLVTVRAATLRLDPESGRASVIRGRGALAGRRDFALTDLPAPLVILRDSEDGRYPVLRLPLPQGRAFELAHFTTQAEAEIWRDRIAAMLGR